MGYNLRNPAVKRLMKEAAELREPCELFAARPLEDNLFEWHFTVRGPPETDFEGGLYHGRISLPPQYPMKPPSILLLTPNGRFELNKKICLSISGHHPESWQPSWSIRTALLAMIGFMPSHGGGAIGALDYPGSERRALAKRSRDFRCSECGLCLADALPPLTSASNSQAKEAAKLATQIAFAPPPSSSSSPPSPSADEDCQDVEDSLPTNSPPEEQDSQDLRRRANGAQAEEVELSMTTAGEAVTTRRDSGLSLWTGTFCLLTALIGLLLLRRLLIAFF